MSASDNPLAFPRTLDSDEVQFEAAQRGMSLRDYFAIHANAPSADRMLTERGIDRGRNPHNEPHKPMLRSDYEIEAALRYRFADAMLAERAKAGQP